MKHYEKVDVPPQPAKQVDVYSHTTCDWCGEKIGTNDYVQDKITISGEEGYMYPEGGNYTITYTDMCQKCYFDRLVPFLKSQGVTFHEKEIEV